MRHQIMLAAVLTWAATGCVGRSEGGRAIPTFSVSPVETRKDSELGFQTDWVLTITASDTTFNGILLVELVFRRMADPSKPDTLLWEAGMLHGRAKLSAYDYQSRCTEYSSSGCSRERGEAALTWRIVGCTPVREVK